MKAILLVGGQGTRLRPLTLSKPKPLLPLANRPFLDHVLFLLNLHGISDVVLAVGYRSESFEPQYGDGSHLGVRLHYVREDKPLDTGWAIKNVESFLAGNETFLVFNGDILTDLDLTDMLRQHREHGAVCTISLTSVDDPSAYGVVDMDEEGRVQRFTEKPKREEATSNWINAGTYLLEPEVLQYISEPQLLDEIPPGRPYSVEYGLFPKLLEEGLPIYGYRTGAYWLDIGSPAKYLQAQTDLMSGRLKYNLPPEGEELWQGVWAGEGTFIDSGARVTGPAVLGRNCKVRANAALTGPLALGDNCEVGEHARLDGIIAWDKAYFGEKADCRQSIFGNNAQIGEGSHIDGVSVIGDDATIGANNRLSGEKVDIGESLPDSEAEG